jgi:hypothetical protein
MPRRTVAYLDILGFKSYTSIDAPGAAQLLLNYNEVLRTKLADMAQFPADGYDDPGLRKLAQVGEVRSFETAIPCSDSLVVTSNQPDLLVRQLSRFMLDSFEFTSQAFAHPKDPLDPTAVTIGEVSLKGVARRAARWFPLLFRGGIASGDVRTLPVTAIINATPKGVTNLTGPAVVDAVALEKTGKGPRLFSARHFRDQLTAASQELFAPVPDTKHDELLWPMVLYHDPNSPCVDINHFSDLFLPAVKLWRSFSNDPRVEPHYMEFLKLIVRATLKAFGRRQCYDLAVDHIKGRLAAYKVEELSAMLFGSAAGCKCHAS